MLRNRTTRLSQRAEKASSLAMRRCCYFLSYLYNKSIVNNDLSNKLTDAVTKIVIKNKYHINTKSDNSFIAFDDLDISMSKML